mgnify:CR=1 FL=1
MQIIFAFNAWQIFFTSSNLLESRPDKNKLTKEEESGLRMGAHAAQIGNKVRIGVEADKHIPVHRFEVYQEIHKGENGSNKNLSSM